MKFLYKVTGFFYLKEIQKAILHKKIQVVQKEKEDICLKCLVGIAYVYGYFSENMYQKWDHLNCHNKDRYKEGFFAQSCYKKDQKIVFPLNVNWKYSVLGL